MRQADLQRRTVLFSGQVQGVGFRYTTLSVARGFDVRGSVRNLPDGRVELIAEGMPIELRRFIAAIHAKMGSFIRDAKISDMPPTNEFKDFSIRH